MGILYHLFKDLKKKIGRFKQLKLNFSVILQVSKGVGFPLSDNFGDTGLKRLAM